MSGFIFISAVALFSFFAFESPSDVAPKDAPNDIVVVLPAGK